MNTCNLSRSTIAGRYHTAPEMFPVGFEAAWMTEQHASSQTCPLESGSELYSYDATYSPII